MMELEDSTCEYMGWNWSLQQRAQGWGVGHVMRTQLAPPAGWAVVAADPLRHLAAAPVLHPTLSLGLQLRP